MKRPILLLALSLPLSALAKEDPARFSARWPIKTEAGAPYYRLSLPLGVYLASAYGDLRDLRVFDANGQPLPHARLSLADSRETRLQRQNLNWFPLSMAETPGTPALSLSVKQGQDGTLVEFKTPQTSPKAENGEAPPLRGYVLDASRIEDREAAQALILDWEKGADFQRLDVEASEDLQHWRTLASGAQLARLAYQGTQIEQRRIELPGLRERYLRLVWQAPAQAPRLTLAELELTHSRYLAAPLVWSAPMKPSHQTAGQPASEYRFHLPKPLPLASLRLELAPGNRLMPLEIRTPGPHSYRLASGVVYRIGSQGREWLNTEIPLDGRDLQDFVLKPDPRLGSLPEAPQLSFAIRPEQILFLAGGSPPYTLAAGLREAQESALPPSTLVPGLGQPGSPEISRATLLNEASAGTAALPKAQARLDEQDWKKLALWAVLGLGVLGLAAMVWQLLGQMKKGKSEE